jgi:hypothetical protein
MLTKGDLVRIPAETCLVQEGKTELTIVDRFKFTSAPGIGIFIKYERGLNAKVFVGNQFWIVNYKDIKFVETKC